MWFLMSERSAPQRVLHQAENVRRDGDHADSQDGGDSSEGAPDGSDGVDVTITDGGEGSDRPQKAGKRVGGFFWLSGMFGMVLSSTPSLSESGFQGFQC